MLGDLVDLVMQIGKSGLQLLGFIFVLGGLLLVTSPNRYPSALNATLTYLNAWMPANWVLIIGFLVILAGAYILMKTR